MEGTEESLFQQEVFKAASGWEDHVESAPSLKLAKDIILFYRGKLGGEGSDFSPDLKLENGKSM